MDRVLIFIFLYGATACSGAVLSFFWTRFAISRGKRMPHPWLKDRTFVLALAIALVSLGLTLIDGARAVGNLEFGLSSILRRDEAWFIGAGLIATLAGMFKMGWLADLEVNPPHWTWLRFMLGLTVLWAVVAILLAPGVPYHG